MHGPLQNFYYFPAWRECLHLRELRWPILDSDCTNVCAFNGLLGPNAPLVYTFHSHSMFRFSKIHFPSGKKNYFSRGHPPNCSTLERFQVTPCKKSRVNLKINKGFFFSELVAATWQGVCHWGIAHSESYTTKDVAWSSLVSKEQAGGAMKPPTSSACLPKPEPDPAFLHSTQPPVRLSCHVTLFSLPMLQLFVC